MLDDVDIVKDTCSEDESEDEDVCPRNAQNDAPESCPLAQVAPPSLPPHQMASDATLRQHHVQPQHVVNASLRPLVGGAAAVGRADDERLRNLEAAQPQSDSEPEPEEGMAKFRGGRRGALQQLGAFCAMFVGMSCF